MRLFGNVFRVGVWAQMAGSLDSLRGGLESHEGELAKLCEDVGRRAEQASKEMLDFKDKASHYYCCTTRRCSRKTGEELLVILM